jgi:hypothetical protein
MSIQSFICMFHLLLYSEYGFKTKVRLLFCNFMVDDRKSRNIPSTYPPVTLRLILPRKYEYSENCCVIFVVFAAKHRQKMFTLHT